MSVRYFIIIIISFLIKNILNDTIYIYIYMSIEICVAKTYVHAQSYIIFVYIL